MGLLRSLGRSVIAFFTVTGRIGIFTSNGVFHSIRPPYFPRLVLQQMIEIGFYSLPVVGLTAIFTGAVLALQSFSGFGFAGEATIANVVVWGITRELGPVLAGLMVAGRIGAAMAAEIGTMRVTEQIDALTTLSTNPFKYLVAPRLIAAVAMMPLLVIVADIIGRADGHLSRLLLERRRPGRRPGDHQRRGVRFDFDPAVQLHHHGDFFLEMTPTPPANTPQAKIEVRDLHKSFGAKQVLRGVNLAIQPGESIVVIGGSGTGKSVLIKNIIGLMHPDSGTILVDGEDVTAMTASEREQVTHKFGMLFQGAALFDSLPVWENVAFGLIQVHRLSRREARDKALEAMVQVGLDPDIAQRYPAELSGGMQKRVGLARAIATEPEIMFFDEPTTGLDPIMGSVIDNLIVESVRELGATALSITHDMASARRIADTIAMIYDGKIVWHGPADAIDDTGNEVVDQFIHGRSQGPIDMLAVS
jgi:phospholipid/cholesterol/gamma-HCH transport system ATP-binding protein